MFSIVRGWAVCGLVVCPVFAMADTGLQVAGIFSDHMVLQRNIPIKVWGTAKPDGAVTVKFNGSTSEGKADKSGKWLVKLPEQKAGGPYELTVSADNASTTVKDILVGEVWVCSGQSNMDFELNGAKNAKQAIASSANNNIRLFDVPKNKTAKPLDDLSPTTTWKICGPETAGDFSAVGYFFGRDLQKELKVPIGLIESSWGGTAAEWWTPLEGLQKMPYMEAEAKAMETAEPDSVLEAKYNEAVELWHAKAKTMDPGNGNGSAGWANKTYDDSAWEKIALPEGPNGKKLIRFDGSVWYRRTIDLSEDQAKSASILTYNADDADVAYVNGQKVGASDFPQIKRSYIIPANVLKSGSNTLCIQVWDWGKLGGIWGNSDSLAISFSDDAGTSVLTLAGDWKTTKGISLADVPGRPANPPIRASVLYNAMIAPLLNFGIKGVIWYQGEHNAGNHDRALIYDQTMVTLINEWRQNWNLGDFPFFQVQLASFMKNEPEPSESDWAVLRESQENVLNLVKNTAFASAVDVGDEANIHPINKETVGARLALNALAVAYDKKIEYLGPIFKAKTIEGDKVTISFSHADKLVAKDGEKLMGFAIAGEDKKFVWADATIDGDKVIVSNELVKQPVAVRYGWANFSQGNLYNEAGLPASPFRTDSPKH